MTDDEIDKVQYLVNTIVNAFNLADVTEDQYLATISCVIGHTAKGLNLTDDDGDGFTIDDLLGEISYLAKNAYNQDLSKEEE